MESYHKYISVTFFFLSLILPLTLALQVGFYSKTCPNAETIVQQVVQQRFAADKSITPALLRMHFHDCFVRGCDASILIDSTSTNQAEKAAGPNGSVREFALIDQIKSKLEQSCPKTVSCADIITLATRDSVVLAGGPKYNVPTGRRDGLISRSSEVNVPGPSFTVSQAQKSFSDKGLTLNDMVVLLGAHTVGIAHCSLFQDRLSNFQGTGSPDPTMNKALVTKLTGVCGSNPNVDPTAFLDQKTPFVFDNQYYNQIKSNMGVLQIDQELALDSLSSTLVTNMAANNVGFGQSFAKAMVKMGSIQVLQGTSGEIRQNCRVLNKS
ncbi:peroxidase 57-like [Chenopodium quinoa]|uniref:peroxidase 57-like n=1 Tax=Chenopodium quinoa TaxID=63459 RepID=UPI000B7799C6|nr:peroxidase 57-like [Chenopodium quinoa]